MANHASPDIDFTAIHLWPDRWTEVPAHCSEMTQARNTFSCCLAHCSQSMTQYIYVLLIQTDPSFAAKWVSGHIKAAQALGKPLLLEEVRC